MRVGANYGLMSNRKLIGQMKMAIENTIHLCTDSVVSISVFNARSISDGFKEIDFILFDQISIPSKCTQKRAKTFWLAASIQCILLATLVTVLLIYNNRITLLNY